MSSRLSIALARWIIAAAQTTRYHGTGGYATEGFRARGDERPFPQAETERTQVDEFLRFFDSVGLRNELRGAVVLDLGSGYGGKTVEYRARYSARRVCGVEPFGNMVDRSREYAAARAVQGVEFRVTGPRAIPYPDETFDVVVSHDVLEHVEDPPATIAETWRVLRPGGLAAHVFPVYLGAQSHHLDYVVRVPGLHWIFSARTLVAAVNEVLTTDSRFGTAPQPSPRLSFDGVRYVLPSLNGLSGVHLDTLFARFDRLLLRRIAMGPRGMRFVVNARVIPPTLRDLATATVVWAGRKPSTPH